MQWPRGLRTIPRSTEHLTDKLVECMDETWLIQLRKPRSGYATRTIKEIFTHLKTTAAKLTAKERTNPRAQIQQLEWNRTEHITKYFTDVEDLQIKIEGWIAGLDTTADAMDAATVQMKDNNLLDHRFMRDTASEKFLRAFLRGRLREL